MTVVESMRDISRSRVTIQRHGQKEGARSAVDRTPCPCSLSPGRSGFGFAFGLRRAVEHVGGNFAGLERWVDRLDEAFAFGAVVFEGLRHHIDALALQFGFVVRTGNVGL